MAMEAAHQTGAGLSTLLLAAVTPLLTPDVVLTAACAGVGSWWAVANTETATNWDALKLYIRMFGTATVLCGAGGWLLEKQLGVPPNYAPQVAAFAIALGRDNWRAALAGIATLRKVLRG